MTPERWQDVERVYHAALERAAGERAAFLVAACGGDVALQREVASLLAQASAASAFLEAPATAGVPVADRSPVGRRLGPYLLRSVLGVGGMGEVYEAEHLDTHRRVALKVLNHTLGTEADRLRFLREGQLAASINHPNSLYIFGSEQIDGRLAISMEIATGGTLKDVVHARGPMPVAAAVDAILQVINGLEAAAAAGVLHRDVKPSNCFVDGDGGVKVGDFGLSIATAGQDETQLTLPGTLLCTPAFAPPEQIRGGRLDLRSDIYSTGATLYYLLTGQPPFAGVGVVQLVADVLERDADSPTRLRPDLRHGLATIVQRCLTKDPAARPDSYQRLRRDLLPFSSQAPLVATRGARVMAAMLDLVVVFLLIVVSVNSARSGIRAGGGAVELASEVLYFAILEGFWGASLGKTVFGIRLISPGHDSAGFWRALVRALLFIVVPSLPLQALGSTGVLAPATSPTLLRFVRNVVLDRGRPTDRLADLVFDGATQ